jgi:hypothetical protein
MGFGNAGDMNNQDEQTQGSFSRIAASKFSQKWKGTIEEQQNAQAFWQDFFRDIIGIQDLQGAGIEFEKKVISSKKGTTTRIDVYWKDTLLIEHKSAGKDLEQAEVQAREYVVSLPPAQRPPVIILCDFDRFRIVDILLNKSHEFTLDELPNNLQRIQAVSNRDAQTAIYVQVEADQKAAQLMANLYLQLEKYGYSGHEASVFMVRVLFCLFADDTNMWAGRIFQKLVEDTNAGGSDLGPRLANLFVFLDLPKGERRGPLDPFVENFPHVNGGIFAERIEVINFNGPMRAALVDACNYDWSKINPTIFGALFQNIKSKDDRRALGEHYTTEANIEKAIRPLLFDELDEKLERSWDSEPRLKALQRELGTYKIFDPACGCGNFLITSYKRLRQIELEVIVRLKRLTGTAGQTSLLDVKQELFVTLEQLYGIEYVEWSSQIAKVAMYLADHQENLKLETVLGMASNRFPLTHEANIVQGNALRIDWSSVCPMTPKTIIVGNPPFAGSRKLSDEQRADQSFIWGGIPGSLTTDYVTNWFILASQWARKAGVRFSLVSTNSVTQGGQPSLIWAILNENEVKIDFAHRTFAWGNDASGKAAVHCVIIGMSHKSQLRTKHLWDYPDPKGEAIHHSPKNINAYLIDYDSVLIKAVKSPRKGLPPLLTGNEPRDGGFLSNISKLEAEQIRALDPIAHKYLRPLVGGAELLGKSDERFCLWLTELDPIDLKNSPELSVRVAEVRKNRESAQGTKSSKVRTINTPTLFSRIAQPSMPFMAVPAVSSMKRHYIPVALYEPSTIINNKVFFIESQDLALFMQLQSKLFTSWVRNVSSLLKSDYGVNASSVYNTFPFEEVGDETIARLRSLGQKVLSIREKFSHVSLGDLYDPNLMPVELLRIHQESDKELMRHYSLKPSSTDNEILRELFKRYVVLTKKMENSN